MGISCAIIRIRYPVCGYYVLAVYKIYVYISFAPHYANVYTYHTPFFTERLLECVCCGFQFGKSVNSMCECVFMVVSIGILVVACSLAHMQCKDGIDIWRSADNFCFLGEFHWHCHDQWIPAKILVFIFHFVRCSSSLP